MCETQRLLRPGGAHLIISFRARPFFERLLAAPTLACTLSVHPIPLAAAPGPPPHDASAATGRPHENGGGGDGGGSGGAHAYLLRRDAGAPNAFDPAAAAAVRAYMDGVVKVRPRVVVTSNAAHHLCCHA